ncbi:PBECR4 domain-containing protein [Clostridium sp. CTA-6]
MAKGYTVTDLCENKKLYPDKLYTNVLQDFYKSLFVKKVYVYKLSNNDIIQIVFTEGQFCHLIGFDYFGYEGNKGWDKLLKNPKKISSFSKQTKFKLLQYRIMSFNKIFSILNNPNVYIYEAKEYPEFSYKSIYFAVLKEENRIYKLGIGKDKTNINYCETYLVDLNKEQHNYYLKEENLLKIKSKKILDIVEFNEIRQQKLEVALTKETE